MCNLVPVLTCRLSLILSFKILFRNDTLGTVIFVMRHERLIVSAVYDAVSVTEQELHVRFDDR